MNDPKRFQVTIPDRLDQERCGKILNRQLISKGQQANVLSESIRRVCITGSPKRLADDGEGTGHPPQSM